MEKIAKYKEFTVESLPNFIRVLPKDVNLNFIFDNLRNIEISALVFAFGVLIFNGDPVRSLSIIPFSQVVLGTVIVLFGFALMALNLVQGILSILTIRKVNLIVYITTAFLLHAAIAELFSCRLGV